MPNLTLSAKLDRTDSGTPWGFRLHGGKDFSCPLTIQRVTPGSLAAKCGLQVGDQITKICDTLTEGLHHKAAQQKILSAGNTLELSLQRGGSELRSAPDAYTAAPVSPPGGGFQKPQAAPYSQPQNYNVKPKPFTPGGGSSNGTVPVAMNNQYNTPINMYSVPSVMNSLSSQTANMNIGSDPSPPWASEKPAYAPKVPSTTPSAAGSWKPSIPTGPRNMKVGRMGEARSMPGGQAGRIPMCNACGVAIRGPFVLALDKSWCPNCFNCANPNCGRPLIDCGFVEEDGKLYCEKDYEQYLAPRCAKCGGAIVGEIVNAMKKTYHMNCFLCDNCHQPIGSASFHIEDGKIYCQKDWAALFQTKCYGCQFPVEPGDKWVEALGQNWHSECFNCSTCQINLEGQPFYAKAGKPFCKKHAMGGGGRI